MHKPRKKNRPREPRTDPKDVVEAEVVVPALVVPSPKRPAEPSLGGEQIAWNEELTQPLMEQLVAAARVGGFKATTALACGVRPELLEWWLDEGLRPDAPPLQRQLSARFLSIQESQNLQLVNVVRQAAEAGDWTAAFALLKHRDPLWRGSDKFVERQNAPPELSQAERYRMLVEQMRNPSGELRRAMVEAGIPLPEPKLPEGD